MKIRDIRRYVKAGMAIAFLGYVFYHVNKDFVEKEKAESASK